MAAGRILVRWQPAPVERFADLHPALVVQMDRQGGVFTAAQARAVGHTESQLQALRRRKILVSVRRGVYAWSAVYVTADPQTQHRIDCAAVRLTLEAPAVLSHQSAGVIHGLEMLDADLSTVHVTRGDTSGARQEAGVHHHVAEIPDEHLLERTDALDVTTVARTAVDIARSTDRYECAVAAFDSALRLGVPLSELRAVVDRCRSWPGARFVSTALDFADGRAANPGESWSRVVLAQQGVAPDDLQVAVYDADGLIGYVDFGWKGVVGEFDGRYKYGLSAGGSAGVSDALWAEKKREDRLRAQREVVRWTVADLHEPGRLAARVLAAMARAVARRNFSS
jgi:hypothetical protein